MRIVAVEEHLTFPFLLAGIGPETLAAHGWPIPGTPGFRAVVPPALEDAGAERLAAMDAAGVTTQVLSVPGPGVELVPGPAGIDLARACNDSLARLVTAQPGRFAAFAHLPMHSPAAAADELERSVRDLGLKGALVNGTIDGKFLDHPDFEPVLARAEELGVTLYIHPGIPPQSVRDAYYSNLPAEAPFMLAIAGWGWHAETAVHILRLALSGALDRHPRLKLLIGHMGEGLPAMIERVERVFSRYSSAHLNRNAARAILDQVWVSTSGFTSLPAFLATLMTFGCDRILFSVDYPFGDNRAAVDFLTALPLAPADRQKIAHANADALLALAPTAASSPAAPIGLA
ncbi:MAG: amidohydrolase family protein [Azospirillaceae bacterium]|nr:amidohydrolase family protein [Azospirillaceae bacterium]